MSVVLLKDKIQAAPDKTSPEDCEQKPGRCYWNAKTSYSNHGPTCYYKRGNYTITILLLLLLINNNNNNNNNRDKQRGTETEKERKRYKDRDKEDRDKDTDIQRDGESRDKDREKQTDRKTEMKRDRQRDRETETERDNEIETQTDRQTQKKTDRHREIFPKCPSNQFPRLLPPAGSKCFQPDQLKSCLTEADDVDTCEAAGCCWQYKWQFCYKAK